MSKTPVRVAVTGATGQIGYSIVFRIASGEIMDATLKALHEERDGIKHLLG